ncbi:hypothetical protein A1O7_06293 [Cladophialophora yegresii CBS 114405]|uniref:C2H2-type domain-containing protein n=1 Tax=Cladophialophora yegresii CBS 114405 TaxID=1182544 RepID=W9VTJ2_9EURO|nr:uncharacterized protein A1O7_06293 [Cladophialophora yegresii CBS 114405]EXJ58863.1 hypothetical protein A1O7_06293 [Cladophialophora yegresii CBS 114405]
MPPQPSNPHIQFPCPSCSSVYGAQSTLAGHIRAVHAGHRWSCNACPKPKHFADRSNWQRHVRSSHGQDRFTCHLCKHGDRRVDNFKRHLATKHLLTPGQIVDCVRRPRVANAATRVVPASQADLPAPVLPSPPVVPPVAAELPLAQQQEGLFWDFSASSANAISTYGTGAEQAQQELWDPLSFEMSAWSGDFNLELPAREVADWLPNGEEIPLPYSFGDTAVEVPSAPFRSTAAPNSPFTAAGSQGYFTTSVGVSSDGEWSFGALLAGN